MTGKVKAFDAKKGFGFIIPDDHLKDVFVHYSNIEGTGRRSLVEGQRVQFEIENTPKGRNAIGVSALDNATQNRRDKLERIFT